MSNLLGGDPNTSGTFAIVGLNGHFTSFCFQSPLNVRLATSETIEDVKLVNKQFWRDGRG